VARIIENQRTPLPIRSEKLPEGWHNTEKYGEVYVSPGGIAWVVQRHGDKLESVSAPLTKDDISSKTAVEKRAEALQKKMRRAKTKVLRTTAASLAVSAVSKAIGGLIEVGK